jgi:hypothetical protein
MTPAEVAEMVRIWGETLLKHGDRASSERQCSERQSRVAKSRKRGRAKTPIEEESLSGGDGPASISSAGPEQDDAIEKS